MINKYGIFSLSAMVLFAIGCGDSSNSASAPASVFSADINEETKTIIMKTPTCEYISDTEVMYDSEGEKDTLKYDVGNDTLSLFFLADCYDIDECVPYYYIGNNSSIYGQWREDEESCSDDKVCEVINITSSSVKHYFDHSSACAFELLAQDIQDDYMTNIDFQNEFMDDDGSYDGSYIKVTKKDCNSGSIKLGEATLNLNVLSYSSDETEFIISSDSIECKRYEKRTTLTKTLCTVENIANIDDGYFTESNFREFDQCMNTLLSDVFFNSSEE